MTTIALIVAAGRGVRAGGNVPKQYRPIAGIPLLRRTVTAFVHHPNVDAVKVMIGAGDDEAYADALAGLDLLAPGTGGVSRQETVRLGLESLATGVAPDKILIHDAARPFVSPQVIDRVIEALDTTPGALPGIAVADTLKRVEAGRVLDTVSRDGLFRAQTPQGFRFPDILAAHRQASGSELTDDAAVAERAGLTVAAVDGSEDNVKITTPEDFARAERAIQTGGGEVRIGQGFDVHRFAPDRSLRLCGVDIPHELGLAGHSDADVALHAVTDAILGAVACGDIGTHFPPSDAQWRDADSRRFVEFAVTCVTERGGGLRHIDLTLICQAPKIGPHRTAMQASLAAMTGLEPGRVNIKATTTEGLGFTGRGEGIAAQAVATVHLPLVPVSA